MDDTNIQYLGRSIPQHGFRVFIYGKDGQKKLVNSWNEFIHYIETGEWFASIEELEATKELNNFEEDINLNQEIFEEEPIIKKRGRKKASI